MLVHHLHVIKNIFVEIGVLRTNNLSKVSQEHLHLESVYTIGIKSYGETYYTYQLECGTVIKVERK